jgi:hypothetical protein
MRWEAKDEKRPKNGDVRCRLVFACKRVRVGRFMVWIEFYEVWERYFEPASGNPGWWIETDKKLAVYYG